MTVKLMNDGQKQLMEVVEQLRALGFEGYVPLDVLEKTQDMLYHQDLGIVKDTSKVVQIAKLILSKSSTLKTIEEVIELLYNDTGLDIIENVSDWSDVGEFIINNDSDSACEPFLGFLPEGYVEFIDKEALGNNFAERCYADFENKMVVRIW